LGLLLRGGRGKGEGTEGKGEGRKERGEGKGGEGCPLIGEFGSGSGGGEGRGEGQGGELGLGRPGTSFFTLSTDYT